MPAYVGEVYAPRHSPHFAACRRAVRFLSGSPGSVIGLSGGPDSLALVAACAAEGIAAEAVVVDHQLQEGSGEVAARAAAIARRLGIPARVVTVDVDGVGGMEASAREARYEALRVAAGGRPILVAHTMDDQAETYLLSSLRGHASAMREVTGDIIRPFLGLRRAETVGCCEELGLDYWQDPHNEREEYRRVAVRKQVVPLLAQVGGGDAVPALARAGVQAAADDELLGEMASSISNDCRELADAPEPLRRRWLVRWVADAGAEATESTLRDLDALITDWHGQGPIYLGSQLAVRRRNGRLETIQQPPGRPSTHA